MYDMRELFVDISAYKYVYIYIYKFGACSLYLYKLLRLDLSINSIRLFFKKQSKRRHSIQNSPPPSTAHHYKVCLPTTQRWGGRFLGMKGPDLITTDLAKAHLGEPGCLDTPVAPYFIQTFFFG